VIDLVAEISISVTLASCKEGVLPIFSFTGEMLGELP